MKNSNIAFDIIVKNNKCLNCGRCAEVCPCGVLQATDQGIVVGNVEFCIGCKICENKCKLGLILVKKSVKPLDFERCFVPLNKISKYRPTPQLKFLNLHATQACNLKCVHCYCDSGTAYQRELSPGDAKKIIMEAKDLGLKGLAVGGGGEPLLRENFCYEIIKFGNSNGIHTRLCTNGTLLNKHRVTNLKESGIKLVQVSLDSHDYAIHDEFRGVNGAFHKIINGIKLLREFDIDFVVRATLHSRNYDKLHELLMFCQELGASAFRISLLRPLGRGKRANVWYLNKKQIEHSMITLANLRKESIKRISFITDECYAHLFEPPLRVKIDAQLGCRAGVEKIAVRSDGSVTPCDKFDLKIGNIATDSIKELWENSQCLKDLRNINNITGKCSRCDYLATCGGGCRAMAYEISKDIYAEDSFCWYDPVT